MPFTWTCLEDGHVARNQEELRTHEGEAHGGAGGEWLQEFHPAGGPASRTRRPWSCARCTRQVERADDGSMLCDVCRGVEVAVTCPGSGRHWGSHLECPVCLRGYRQLVGRGARPLKDGRGVRGAGRLVPEHKP